MRHRAALTLVELLVASVVVGVLTTALTQAFAFGLFYPSRAEASREEALTRVRFEDRLGSLLRAAILADGNPNSYFVAGADTTGEPERMTFMASLNVPGYVLASDEQDFEVLNERWGPQGGWVEVSIGLTPVGQGGVETGLFLREQRPPDGDPTQGGTETVLDPGIVELSFEYYDGLGWQTSWDSLNGARRLPAAVRVTYLRDGEEEPRVFVVRLPHSDVTADNPAEVQSS